MHMTEMHQGDVRAKCKRCNKYFVLRSYTTGEDRRFCFTCRVYLQAIDAIAPKTVEHASQHSLAVKLLKASKAVPVNSMWVHYKKPNLHYKIVGHAVLESTDEIAVLYKAQYGESLTFIRPVENFLDTVSIGEVMVSRFSRI